MEVVDAYVPDAHENDLVTRSVAMNGFIPVSGLWQSHLTVASVTEPNTPHINLETYICKGMLSELDCILDILTESDIPYARSGIRTIKSISGNTGSDTAVARVHSWLQDCVEMHESCSSNRDGALPDRVLQIDGPEHVKLHITSNERLPYVCLSHCWGSQEILITTSANLDQHKMGISWGKLPKTFQDAISFTHKLGIKYIWVDSLCILQNSAKDWHQQGSKMADIYENAALTIAAAVSANPKGGCFKKSNPLHQSRIRSFSEKSGNPYIIYTRMPLPHAQFKHNHLPLMKRGW